MNDIIKIRKSLEDLDVLIVEVPETVKHEIKKQEGRSLEALLAPLAASLLQPVVSSIVTGISGRVVREAGIGYKFLVPIHPLNNIEITNYFNYKPRFNGVFFKKQFTYKRM